MRRYFYDTEFLEDGNTIELISIGIVSGNGREYYAVNADMPLERIKKHDWLVHNVLPTLPLRNRMLLDRYLNNSGHSTSVLEMVEIDRTYTTVKPHWVIANEVRDFLRLPEFVDEDTELWAYYGAYDHVALCQLWGKMIELPKGIPMFTHELMQLWENAGKPTKPEKSDEHNALADARWNRKLYQLCREE